MKKFRKNSVKGKKERAKKDRRKKRKEKLKGVGL
jgi:hypothetical protein